jgi:endonuclease/exonuclease/phosphatase family metal-dependent hydrolase
VLNTHLLANFDGDWSESNRYYRLQHQQLTTLADVVAALDRPAIITGDFNIAGNSPLFRTFIQETGLLNTFGDNCPPTFHEAYLRPRRPAHCIDFLLLSDPSITVKTTQLTFTTPLPMPNGPDYLSDHLGLQATLTL